jgi:hypothetical protein
MGRCEMIECEGIEAFERKEIRQQQVEFTIDLPLTIAILHRPLIGVIPNTGTIQYNPIVPQYDEY